MSQNIQHHVFPNGLTLLLETMQDVRSASFNFLMPAGCAYDPPGQAGMASLLTELITRGAGRRDMHQLMLALDNLGVDRSESVGSYHLRFWGATLARNLPAALEIYRDILREPHLPEDELEPVVALALQDLAAIEDSPGQKLMIELRKRYLPAPLSNERRGTREGIENLTSEKIRQHYQKLFHPRDCIVSVAGNVEWESLKRQIELLFGDWEPGPREAFTLVEPSLESTHLQKDTSQTTIGMACPSVPIGHPDYYSAMGAVNVLSGGMSARLFTEVREKRGLCYSVRASYLSYKEQAHILASAGTTKERAQETLDVLYAELQRLGEGIEDEEVERMKAGLKSGLIMEQESTSSRAGSLASDWFYLGRVRRLEELQEAVDNLSPESILAYLKKHPLENFVIVTLGPEPLRSPEPVSTSTN